MLLAWAIIALLILLTGLYVAAEFAAVSARRSRLRRLAEDGNGLAARLLPVLENPQRARSLHCRVAGRHHALEPDPRRVRPGRRSRPHWRRCSSVSARLEPETAQSTAAAVVLVFLTILAVVLGELVPKSLALQHPTRTALFTVLPMQWSMRVFAWSISLLNGSGVLLLKLLRRALERPPARPFAGGDRAAHRREPRRRAARAGRAGPAPPRAAARPADRKTADGAARAARGARRVAPFHDVLRLVATSPYSRLPVYRGSLDNVIGMLHIKDVVTRFVQSGRLSVASLLRPIVRVPESMPADRLLAFLRERRSHQALVVDATRISRRADHARGRRRRAARRRRRRVQGRAASRRSACPTDGFACPGRCGWNRRCRSSVSRGAAADTVGGLIVERLQSSSRAGRRAGRRRRAGGDRGGGRRRRHIGDRRRAPDRAGRRRRGMTAFLIMTALILLNGIFVAAEFAIVGAPRAAIERRAATGNRMARAVHAVLEDPQQQDRYIATAQLGITVASLGLGMYGEHVLADRSVRPARRERTPRMARLARRVSSVLAVAILTYFHIVVGEMVPKSLALQHAERMVLWITPPMLWLRNALYPFVVGAEQRRERWCSRCSASIARGTTPISTTRPKSCSSSSRRARSLARSASSRDRCCRSCSSSATGRRAR